MQILSKDQIRQKIKRLAIEILENNYREKQIVLAGINNNGMVFARLLRKELKSITASEIVLTRIRLNPANPIGAPVSLAVEPAEIVNKVVIVVDDVANTGRTIFYAMKPLLEVLPKKVEVAVLVDRKHKSFPIQVDYVGISLATTLNENIDVQIQGTKNWAVRLD